MIPICPACGSKDVEMDPGDITKRICLACGLTFQPRDDWSQVGDGTNAELVDRPPDAPPDPDV